MLPMFRRCGWEVSLIILMCLSIATSCYILVKLYDSQIPYKGLVSNSFMEVTIGPDRYLELITSSFLLLSLSFSLLLVIHLSISTTQRSTLASSAASLSMNEWENGERTRSDSDACQIEHCSKTHCA